MRSHHPESIERAVITLREMTQSQQGRGISAVMMLEEQIATLTKHLEMAVAVICKIERSAELNQAAINTFLLIEMKQTLAAIQPNKSEVTK